MNDVIETEKKSLPAYMVEAITRGYKWECGCGELYRTQEAARGCRKCRQYLTDNDFSNRTETDISL